MSYAEEGDFVSYDNYELLEKENAELKARLDAWEKQEPVAWILPTIPVRIVDHSDFNANYGGTVTPLFTRPKPIGRME
jgi:hypothetical protein